MQLNQVQITPSTIASCTVFLLNCALTNLLTCLASLFAEPRIMMYSTGACYISHEICKFTSYKSCLMEWVVHSCWCLKFRYAVILLFYGHLNMSQLGKFLFHWYNLRFPTPMRMMVFVMVPIFASPSLYIVHHLFCKSTSTVNRISNYSVPSSNQ